jgi:cobalt-zinc-cadmium efflux system outer membrane protein
MPLFQALTRCSASLLAVFCCMQLQAQQSLTFKQALQYTINSSPFLKSQSYTVDAAKADITTAQLRPNFNLSNQSINLVRSKDLAPNSTTFSPINRQVQWQLYKPIQWPGQRSHKIEVAEKALTINQFQFQEVQRQALYNVAINWLQAWNCNQQIQLLQMAKTNLDSLVAINKYRLEKQVISQTDLTRTQLLADQFDIQIQNTKLDYITSLNNLTLYTGASQAVTAVDTQINFGKSTLPTRDSLLQQAMLTRPDMLVAHADIEWAKSNIKLQESLAYPTPNIGVLYNPQNTIPYWGIYADIDLPLFSRNQGEIKKAKISLQQNEQQLQAQQMQVNTEVANAWKSYNTQQNNLKNIQSCKIKRLQYLIMLSMLIYTAALVL